MSSPELREVVYTADAQLRRPLAMLRDMMRDLRASRELAWRLFVREMSTQYRQTALGYFWAVLPPLVTGLIFILLNAANILRVRDTGVPYPVFVIMGTVFFGLFAEAVNAPLRTITGAQSILVKINFPREALLVAGMGQVILSFAIKLVPLAGAMIIFGVPPKITVLLLPVPLAGLLLIGTMVGVLLVPVGMLFRDIGYGLTFGTTGLFYLTPVAFPPPAQGMLSKIVAYNPLTPLMMSARELVVTGTTAYTVSMLLVILATVFLLFCGWVLFRLALPIIVERFGV